MQFIWKDGSSLRTGVGIWRRKGGKQLTPHAGPGGECAGFLDNNEQKATTDVKQLVVKYIHPAYNSYNVVSNN